MLILLILLIFLLCLRLIGLWYDYPLREKPKKSHKHPEEIRNPAINRKLYMNNEIERFEDYLKKIINMGDFDQRRLDHMETWMMSVKDMLNDLTEKVEKLEKNITEMKGYKKNLEKFLKTLKDIYKEPAK